MQCKLVLEIVYALLIGAKMTMNGIIVLIARYFTKFSSVQGAMRKIG